MHLNSCNLDGCPANFYDKNLDRICVVNCTIIPDCDTCLYDNQISSNFVKCTKCVKNIKKYKIYHNF